MGAKKEPRHRREGRGEEGEIKRDMTVTRPKTKMRLSPELRAGVTKLASLLVMSVCSTYVVCSRRQRKEIGKN